MYGFVPLGIPVQLVWLLKLTNILNVWITRIYRQCLRKHFKISEMHFMSDDIMVSFQILGSHRSKWLKDGNNFASFTSSEDFLASNACLIQKPWWGLLSKKGKMP